MKSNKDDAIALINKLPEGASWDAILAELHFKVHVLKGLDDIERGRVISHDEMKDWVSQWLTSSGR